MSIFTNLPYAINHGRVSLGGRSVKIRDYQKPTLPVGLHDGMTLCLENRNPVILRCRDGNSTMYLILSSKEPPRTHKRGDKCASPCCGSGAIRAPISQGSQPLVSIPPKEFMAYTDKTSLSPVVYYYTTAIVRAQDGDVFYVRKAGYQETLMVNFYVVFGGEVHVLDRRTIQGFYKERNLKLPPGVEMRDGLAYVSCDKWVEIGGPPVPPES